MANILWSVLNMVLLLGACALLFRAVQLVWQRVGRGAALFLALALVLLLNQRPGSPAGPAKNLLAQAPTHGPVANAGTSKVIALGGTNQLFLRAEYNIHGSTLTPKGLYATVSGIVLGHQWEPSMGMLQPEGPRLHYWAVLNHRWLLLGTPVFTSSGEVFEGMLKPDQPLAQR